jgi:crossover junction endodeoxyribonuclease RuvC
LKIKIFRPMRYPLKNCFSIRILRLHLPVGHGRGVAVLAAAKSGIDIFEYTPLQVKQSVVGYGRAEKAQIQQMVKAILNLPAIPKPDDVADALAVAICHGNSHRMGTVLGNGRF